MTRVVIADDQTLVRGGFRMILARGGIEVLRLLGGGLSNTEPAARLQLGEATVKTHVARIFSPSSACGTGPRPSWSPTGPASSSPEAPPLPLTERDHGGLTPPRHTEAGRPGEPARPGPEGS